MPKVLIAPSTLANRTGSWHDTLRDAGFEFVFPSVSRQLLENELMELLSGVDASLAGSEPYTRRVIAAHPQLRVIARAGVGYDAVDVPAATERGIAVCTTPGTNHDAVAEYTFTMLLALAKRLIPLHLATMAGGWPRQVLIPLRGRTLGILGLGRIGKAVALRGKVFGMKLLAYEPYPDQKFVAEQGVTLAPLEQVIREADFLTLHVPLSAESKYMINKNTLAMMKPTAFLVNTARGALVHEHDLADALRAKKIAGAGIDVFELEPPGKSPLFELDNVVVAPHVAGVDSQALSEMAQSAARSIVRLLKGEWPEAEVVNQEVRGKFTK
jgi:phosphoglycerate dehydrogenase-like enzyme